MEATVYQGGRNGVTSYFFKIDDQVTQVPHLTGPAPSLENEFRMHKAKFMSRGNPLSLFHPQTLELRLSDEQARILQSRTGTSIHEPPAP